MTTEQQAALDKIKKLLAMKRGGTQHEAETAEALAAALALKAGIDLDTVSIDDAPPAQAPITHRTFGEWVKAPPEATYSLVICVEFFNVSSMQVSGWTDALIAIGTERDLDIAGYVFNFLKREFCWQWNHRSGRSRKRTAFIYGCYCGLVRKLRERAPQGEGLVVHEEERRKRYMREKWPNSTSESIEPKKGRDGAARRAGYGAGLDIEIRGGLKPSPEREPAPRLGNNGHDRKLLQPANGQLGLL